MAEHEVTQTPCVPLYGLLAASLAASTTSTVSHVNVQRDDIVWDRDDIVALVAPVDTASNSTTRFYDVNFVQNQIKYDLNKWLPNRNLHRDSKN